MIAFVELIAQFFYTLWTHLTAEYSPARNETQQQPQQAPSYGINSRVADRPTTIKLEPSFEVTSILEDISVPLQQEQLPITNKQQKQQRAKKSITLPYNAQTAHKFLRTALDIMDKSAKTDFLNLNKELEQKGPFLVSPKPDSNPSVVQEAVITFTAKLMGKVEEVISEGCELRLTIGDGKKKTCKAKFQGFLSTKMIVKESSGGEFKDLKQTNCKVEFLYNEAIIAKKRALVRKLNQQIIFPQSPAIGLESDTQDLEWISKLNPIQKRVIKVALNLKEQPFPPPFLVRGPPGTGKTTTLVELILQIVAKETHPLIVVCTPSNRAADNIIERIPINDDLKVLRFLSDAKLSKLTDKMKLPGIDYSSEYNRYPVVVCTVGKLHSFYSFQNRRTLNTIGDLPTHLIVDEASQVPDTDMILALGLLKAANTRFIMFGDDRQLGPVITEDELKYSPLNVSMFERLVKKNKTSSSCLLENYRSVPGVVAPFNKLFYKNTLISKVNPRDNAAMFDLKFKIHRTLMPGDSSIDPSGVYFQRVVGACFPGESKSWRNKMEAEAVKKLFGKLTNIRIEPRDIGIITPYIDQVRLLQGMIKSNAVTIGSVDSFQGQERSVIIVSTVRSIGANGIGFVADQKRLNVTISRAKTCLIIVGNDSFLAKNSKDFKDLIGLKGIEMLK